MREASKVKIGVVTMLIIFGMIVAGLVGWVMNIFGIAHSDFNNVDGMLILRVIGVFMFPIGAVVGYF
jgi:hypothetical protein